MTGTLVFLGRINKNADEASPLRTLSMKGKCAPPQKDIPFCIFNDIPLEDSSQEGRMVTTSPVVSFTRIAEGYRFKTLNSEYELFVHDWEGFDASANT